MANKADRFYFDNFVQASEQSCRAAHYLVESLTNYDATKMSAMLEELHTIEHEGDGKKHELSAALAKAFVTPIDREDLDLISHNIDDVTDGIEEVLQRFYMDMPKQVTPESILMAQKVSVCCQALVAMLEELPNFKKPEQLMKTIIQISDAEEDCDRIYLEAYRKVTQHTTDPLEVIAQRKVYEYLERCSDACEHVADVVEMIVMKNS
jgi:predicted phosphate transport protein (TIGR00153 family)